MLLKFYRQTTISNLWCPKLGETNSAKNSVRYREIFRPDTIYRCQSPKNRDVNTISQYIEYCDIAWYGIWYHDASRYVMRYHTGSPPNTRQTQFNENIPPRCCLLLFLSALSPPSSWLVLRLEFFVVLLLSINWTHHRTDRTRKQQPCPLRTHPAPWARDVCYTFIVHIVSFIYQVTDWSLEEAWSSTQAWHVSYCYTPFSRHWPPTSQSPLGSSCCSSVSSWTTDQNDLS